MRHCTLRFGRSCDGSRTRRICSGGIRRKSQGPTRRHLPEAKAMDEEEDPRHSVLNIFNAGPAVQVFGPAYALVVPDLYPIMGPNPNPWRVPQYLAGDVPRFKQPYLLTDQIFAGGCGWTVPTLGTGDGWLTVRWQKA